MYRLTIRRQYFFFVGSLLLCLGLVIFLPSHSPDKVLKSPLLLILIIEIAVSFGLAAFCYQNAPIRQIIKAGMTFLAVTTGIGLVGNLTSQVNQPLPGIEVLISWIQLVIMNIGGALCTLALYEVNTGPGYKNMQEAASDIVRTVKPRASVSATKLPALADPLHPPASAPVPDAPFGMPAPATEAKDLSASQPPAPLPKTPPSSLPTPAVFNASTVPPPTPTPIPTPAAAPASPIPDLPIAKASEPSAASAEAQEARRAASITSQRIQVQSKRKPSTFTKLQALSATGRSLTAPPGSGDEGLKSILDRLEDQAESAGVYKQAPAPAVASLPAASATASAAASPAVPKTPAASAPAPSTASPSAFAPPTPASQPVSQAQPTPPPQPAPAQQSQGKGEGIASRLVGVVTKNKMPAAQKPAFKFDPEPEPGAESQPTAQASTQPAQALSPGGAFPSGAAEPDWQSESADAAASVFEPKTEDVGASSHVSGDSAPPQLPTSNIFESAVDDEMDQIFSKLVSADAQKEVETRQAEEPVEAVTATGFAQEEAFDVSTQASESIPEAVDYSHSFSPEIVEEISQAELPAAATSAEPTGEHLFGPEVDSEIDDIFSALAPAEAQREVEHAQPAPAAVEIEEESLPQVAASQGAAPETAAAQEGLFGEEIDSEIDDIFSNLAPPEAQLNVSDRSAASAAHPQAQPTQPAFEQAEPAAAMSFDPPHQVEESTVEASSEPLEEEEPAEDEEAYSEEEISDDSPIVNPVTKNIEVREFGRLSSKSAAAKGQQNAAGTMKTIGKLLIDVQAVENIIKGGETGKLGAGLASARVITAARGEGIKALLGKIDTYQGVTGCLIVGHDGLVIASTISGGEDKDALGALSSALLSTSNLATLKLEIGKLRQMVLLTDYANGQATKQVTTVLTDVDVGVLAVFLDGQQLDRLDGLLETIHATIHG